MMLLILEICPAQQLLEAFVQEKFTLQEPKIQRKVDFRDLFRCHHDNKPADEDEDVCKLQPAAYFSDVYKEEITAEDKYILETSVSQNFHSQVCT